MSRPYCLRRGEGTPPYDLLEKGYVGRACPQAAVGSRSNMLQFL